MLEQYIQNLVASIQKSNACDVLRRNDGSVVAPEIELVDAVDPGAIAMFEKTEDRVGKVKLLRSSVIEAMRDGNNFDVAVSVVHEWGHATQASNEKLDDCFDKNLSPRQIAHATIILEGDAFTRAAWATKQLQAESIVSKPSNSNLLASQFQDIYEQAIENSHESGDAEKTLFRTFLFGSQGQLTGFYAGRALEEYCAHMKGALDVVNQKDVKGITINHHAWIVGEREFPSEALLELGKIGENNYMADDNGQVEWVVADGFMDEVLGERTQQQTERIIKYIEQMGKELKPFVKYVSPQIAEPKQQASFSERICKQGNESRSR